MLWLTLTLLLAVKLMVTVLALLTNVRFVLRGSQGHRLRASGSVRLNVLIPLLREHAVLPALFERLTRAIEIYPDIRLYFVTTEREALERAQYPNDPDTGLLLEDLRSQYAGPRERIVHFHYPGQNRVVAEQLNFAVAEMTKGHFADDCTNYIAVYNADSVIEPAGFQQLLDHARTGAPVGQQSSFFLWNVPELLKSGHDYSANHGIYQSCWTLHHELTRYMFCRHFLPCLPKWVEQHSLVHCVGHGLIIRADVLDEMGGFPTFLFGLEDLGLGFLLKVHGYHVYPIPNLENAETPGNARTLWRQLPGWFLGTAGYLVYWRALRPEILKRYWTRVAALTLLGLLDSLKWLLKGPVILLYLWSGWVTNHLMLSTLLYLVYFYMPFCTLMWLWSKLPPEAFPRANRWLLCRAALSYFLVPILRSGPAWLGVWWGFKIATGQHFVRPKTERV